MLLLLRDVVRTSWFRWLSYSLVGVVAASSFLVAESLAGRILDAEVIDSEAPPVPRRGAQVTGRVVDADGTPIPDVPVSLYVEERRLSQRTLVSSSHSEPDFQALSDAEGTFRVTGLPEDRFDVLIDPPGFGGRILRGVDVPDEGVVDLGRIELEPSRRITGFVLDAQDRPVPEARVTLLSADGFSRTLTKRTPLEVTGGTAIDSQADGSFRFEDVPSGGRFVLHASAPERVPSMAFDVAADGTEPIELILRPAARLFGRVEDPSRGPVPGVWVQLIDPEEGGVIRWPMGRERSDEHGRFAFEGLPAGAYGFVLGDHVLGDVEIQAVLDLAEGEEKGPVVLTQSSRAALEVQVTGADFEPAVDVEVSVGVVDGPRLEASADAEGKVVFDDLPPGQIVVSARHPLLGTAEQRRSLQPGPNDVTLVLESGGRIRGRVVDADGEPVANAQLDLEPVDATLSALAHSEPDGSFEMKAPSPGTYRLRTEARGWASADLPLEVGARDLEGIEVRLSRGTDLVGRVLGLEAEDLTRVRVSARSRATRRFVKGVVSHDGGYRIQGLGSGAWQVTGELSDPRRVVEEQVTVDPESERAELDLQFSEGYALSGVVRLRDEPADRAVVYLRGMGSLIEDRTDGSGSFRFAGLEPGEYRLSVSVFASDLGTQRTVSIDSDRTLEIVLLSTRISGRLVSSRGDPVPGVGVQVLPIDDPDALGYGLSSTFTREDGRFFLPPVAEGSYRLIAQVPDLGSVAERIEAAGSDLDVGDVLVERGRTLSFLPRRADGSPVETIAVVLMDAARNLVGGGQASADPDGVFRLPHVPEAARMAVVFPGTSDPLIAPRELPIPEDAEPVPVEFPVGSRILIRWDDAASLHAAVRLYDAEGRLPPRLELSPGGGEPMAGKEHSMGSLLPGVWTVELLAPDGSTETREVTTRPGETTEVVFTRRNVP